MISAPFDAGSDEIDLDRTLEALLDAEVLDSSRVIVRHRRRMRRALALLVDTSGSMRGERVKTAAATVGALAAEFADEQLAVIAFWSDAAVLLELGAPVDTARLIGDLLALPGQGLTNISFPLEVAGRALAGRAGYEQRASAPLRLPAQRRPGSPNRGRSLTPPRCLAGRQWRARPRAQP